MARTVSLGQLTSDIREQADAVGASVRHTPQLITRFINQSIQRFREKITGEGSTHYLTATSGTLTVGATSPYSFSSLSLASVAPSVVRTCEMEITVNSEVLSLLHVPFASRNDYGGPTSTGIPQAWAHYQTRTLAIMPAPNQTYAYTVWYLPVLTDLVNDTDTFDGVAGWEDFVVWDVVRRLIVRDQYPQAFSLATAYTAELWADIVTMATRVSNAGGASIGRDTFGQRMYGLARSRTIPWST
jgi:hypothetical protein